MSKEQENKYRICKICPTFHYENCGTCFGWGVLKRRGEDGIIPISAGKSIEGVREPWEACPECESTPAGLGVNEDYEQYPLTIGSYSFLAGGIKGEAITHSWVPKSAHKTFYHFIREFQDGTLPTRNMEISIGGVPLADDPFEFEFRPPHFSPPKPSDEVFEFRKPYPLFILSPTTSYGPVDYKPKGIIYSADEEGGPRQYYDTGKWMVIIGTVDE